MDTFLLPSQQKESPHGDRLSPYALYHCVLNTNTSPVLLHWHEEAEFGIIREGRAIYQIGQESYLVQAGDLLFIAPNTLHSITPQGRKALITDTIVFHLDMVGYSIMDQCTISYLRPLYNGTRKPTPLISPAHPAYPALFNSVNTAVQCVAEQPRYHELLLKEALIRSFFLLFNHDCLTETNVSKSTAIHIEKVKLALLFIQEHYSEPITISQLAELCSFSEVHFMNFFKKAVGIPCMEYIIQLRLKISADLLSNTTRSISEIAFDCGFNNLSNFNRKFKAFFQVTPTNYRKAGD